MRILVIDDSQTNLVFARRLLGTLGNCETLTYLDPLEALEFAREEEVDLVLVDYRMPGIDGIEFVRRFRAMRGEDVPVVMVTGSDEKEVRHGALDAGANDFVSRPLDTAELRPRIRNLLKLRKAVLEARDAKAQEGRRADMAVAETALRLTRAGAQRDNETGEHVVRMAFCSRIVAEKLGLDPAMCEMVHQAAPLHDVGKIGIPDAILLKPGKLEPHERAEMERHSELGFQILEGSGLALMQMGAEMARSHHERWDGEGYPHRLAGEDIPLVARIVAVADVFDALVSERPYKRAWSLEEAKAYLIDKAGSQFDPACVAAFIAGWHRISAMYEESRAAAAGERAAA